MGTGDPAAAGAGAGSGFIPLHRRLLPARRHHGEQAVLIDERAPCCLALLYLDLPQSIHEQVGGLPLTVDVTFPPCRWTHLRSSPRLPSTPETTTVTPSRQSFGPPGRDLTPCWGFAPNRCPHAWSPG